MLTLACAVQSAFGFGLALLALPLLVDTRAIGALVPLLALLSLTIGGGVAWRTRRDVDRPLLWRVLLAASLGVPLGAALLVHLDADTARAVLGAVVVLAALQALRSPTPPFALGPRAVWPFGVLSGTLGGAFNLMGPPLVLFLQWSGLDPGAFRATLHAFAVAINLVVLAVYALGGLLPSGLAGDYALALPAAALGGWLGGRLARYLDAARYRALVHVLLLALGARLLVEALL